MAVIAAFARPRALSMLLEEMLKLRLDAALPDIAREATPRAASTLLEETERLFELWSWAAMAASILED